MFTSEIHPIQNSIEYELKITFHPWGQEAEQEPKMIIQRVEQRKTAYELFITHATEFLRWTSDYLYQLLQKVRPHYLDSSTTPYFGNAQKEWAPNYWLFLDSRDRAAIYSYSPLETAKSFHRKVFAQLIPIYHFQERTEIREAVAVIEKLSGEIIATIKKLHNDSRIPALIQ